jgi:hypothetical protein
MTRPDSMSVSSYASLSEDLKSKTSSFSSNNNNGNSSNTLTQSLIKCSGWLYDLLELHYFAYNSCNSLTIYSHKFWNTRKRLLVATKENNLKEIYFKLAFNDEQPLLLDTLDACPSARSSFSSTENSSAAKFIAGDGSKEDESGCSGHQKTLTNFDNKSNLSINDMDNCYLEPVNKIHKLSKIKSIFYYAP